MPHKGGGIEPSTLPNTVVPRLDSDGGCHCLLGNLFTLSIADTGSTGICNWGVSSRTNQKRIWRLDTYHDLHGIKCMVHDFQVSKSIPKVVGRVVFKDF